MSKVLKVVAIVAVAVAVVVFAPAIGAALASVAGSLGITVAGSAIASYLVGMAITTALTATLTLFRKAPSMSNSMADRLSTSVNPTAPRKIVFGLTAAGNDVRFFETYGKKKDRYAQAVALASHRINAIRGFYVENDLAWNGSSIVSHSDGIESVRAVTEGRPGNGFNLGSGSFWRSTASFTGCAYIAITWKLSSDAWPSGIPSSSRTIVEGCPLYDPRLDSTRGGSGSHRIDNQDTWGWRNGGAEIGRNPALALLTYLIGWRINGKLVWGMGIPAANIDFDSFRTYANICEEQVATQGGGSVQRYTCDGIFSTADAHDTVINAITAAMGSTKMVDVGGAYTLIGGYDDTAGPKVGLTLDDIVGAAGSSTPYVWLPAPASRERFNIVRGRFADPDNLYQLSDWGDPIEQPALADDVPRTMNLDLGCVSRPETCQRIAKQFLLREYLTPGKFSATFGPNAFAAQVGSIVTLTIPQMGWNAKLFRVEEQAETHDMFYQMTLREESAAIYSWDREEKPLPANIRPTGYDPNDTLAPEAFAITSESYAGANGYNVSEVHVSWTPEDSGRVTGIQIYSRPVGVEAWTEQAALHDARTGSFIFTSNAPGIDIEVRARFRMSNAIYGQWVTATVSTAPVVISYDNLDGTPNNLTDINPTEGGKLGGIEAGATVGGIIGGNIKNPDGSLYVPPSRDQLVDTVAPAIPSGLALTSILTDAGSTLKATWNRVSDSDLAGYVIAIRQGAGNYIEFTVGAEAYERTALPRNTAYTAKVLAYDKAGNRSSFSPEVSLTTERDTTPPASVTNTKVETTFNSAFVTWANPGDADLVRVVVRLIDSIGQGNVVGEQSIAAAPGSKGSATWPNLKRATTYSCHLFAYDTSGNESPVTNTGNFTTAGGVALDDFSPGLQPIQTVASLPNPAGYTGPSVVFLQSDSKLYRYANGTWAKEVPYGDLTGAPTSLSDINGTQGTKLDGIATGATIGAPSGTMVGNTPATTVESRANSPAARINEDTVTINGGKITAETIDTGQIKSGAITTDKLTAGAVTTNKLAINGRQISAAELNLRHKDGVLSWNAANIVYVDDAGNAVYNTVPGGSVTGPGYLCYRPRAATLEYIGDYAIRANTAYFSIAYFDGGTTLAPIANTSTVINGGNIQTDTIDANKIRSKSLTAAQIAGSTITANEVATGTLTAAQMATGSLTASVIAVGNPDSIIGDSDFRDATWWNSGVPDGRLSVGETGMAENRRELLINPGGGIDVFSLFFPADPGATYRISYGVYTYGDFSGSFRPMIHVPGVMWMSLKGSGIGIDPAEPNAFHNYQVPGQYYRNSFVYTNPSGPDQGRWQFRLAGSWIGKCSFTVKIVRVSDTSLIQDGAITTEKITVNSLNGDRIQVGTLNADKLNASSVLAGTIAVGNQGTLNDIAAQAQNSTPLTFTQYQGIYTFSGNLVAKTGGGNQWDYNGWVDLPQRSSFLLSGKFPGQSTFIGVRQGQGYAVYTGFEYAWHRSSNGNWYIFESGNAVFADTKGGGVVFSDATVFRIEYGGNVMNYWADAGLVRSVPCAPNLTFNAGFAIATPGSSLRFLNWSSGNDNSLANTDPAARINQWSSTIDPGKILIQGQTTLDAWRDQTEIRGGAIKTNSISAEKIAINARGITALGLDFRYEAGRLWWSAGHVLYTDDNGAASSPFIPEGSVAWAGGSYNYILWDKGAGGFRHVVDAWEQGQTRNTNTVIMVTWRNGSNFVANYGGTIVSGDRIVTRSITADRIQAGTIGAYEIAANSITADRMSVGSLSAISGNIGSLVSYNGQGGRVERDGNGTRIYDNNGTLRSWSGF